VRALVPLLTALWALALPGSAAAAACVGDPADVKPLTLTVGGEPATGIVTLPATPPRGLVVFGHGAANTSDAWRKHMTTVSERDGVIAVAMNYRGMIVTGRDEARGTETAHGWPAKAGGEDLVAAAQHFDAECPGLAGIVLYGVSMGGNMTGLGVAAKAKRADGRPLFDYWFAVEGVHNLTETYQEARMVAPVNEFAAVTVQDIEHETGGSLEAQPAAFAERTNLERVSDVAGSGLRGAILVHAFEDGTVPYNQSQEMTRALREAGVPTDLYSVGGRGSDEKDSTLGGIAGAQSGNAGHGWEGSDTHVVIQTGLDRLNALLTRGEPAPCDRDFRVDDQPSNVTPDPREAPAGCKPDPLPPASRPGSTGGEGGTGGGRPSTGGDLVPCRDTAAPARVATRVRRGARRLTLSGRATDRGCGRVARVRVAVARRAGHGRCRFVTRRGRLGRRRSCRRPSFVSARGRETWRLSLRRRRLPHGRYVAFAVAVDVAGHRGPRGRAVRFRL
jgi:prolyl oligopeptidase family protein